MARAEVAAVCPRGEQRALVEPVIAARRAPHPSVSGHRGRYEMREIVDAVLYRCRTGCRWELHRTTFRRPVR
ncbi:transposase [Streptomyces nigra]|uniref:transposase n=1 Tax=Streptomyces nigra TaxID=1827580 RepID=UPI003698B597